MHSYPRWILAAPLTTVRTQFTQRFWSQVNCNQTTTLARLNQFPCEIQQNLNRMRDAYFHGGNITLDATKAQIEKAPKGP